MLRQGGLTDAQLEKFSDSELAWLERMGFDDEAAFSVATLGQLAEPPWGSGGLRLGRANMLLKAFGSEGAG